nr:hypothetical protein [Marinobacter sp. DSM 26671]
MAGLGAADHDAQSGREIVGVQPQFGDHRGLLIEILFDRLFFCPIVIAGGQNWLQCQRPVHKVPLAKLYREWLVEKGAIHGAGHQ